MTEREVEPTREWLDALIDGLEVRSFDPKYSSYAAGFKDGSQFLRDAILASQPERVECDEENHRYFREDNGYKFCPDCGQLLEGSKR